MDNLIQIKIIGDGNCLFRCFSVFLYKTQNVHMKIRLSIVNNVINNWNTFRNFIIGNSYYRDITTSDNYNNYKSQKFVYGNEIEIQSFSDLHNVFVIVQTNDCRTSYSFGNCLSNLKLVLYFSGEKDNGYYDIIECINENRSNIVKINNTITQKRKILQNDCVQNTPVKKQKLYEKRAISHNTCVQNNSVKKQKLSKSDKLKISQLSDKSDFGEMTYKCNYCSAFYWKEETNKSSCCDNGNIFLSPLSKYNEQLKHLLLHDMNFRILIRYYNNLFSFATFSANVKCENQKAINNLKIQGRMP